jgi:hypothetical protein
MGRRKLSLAMAAPPKAPLGGALLGGRGRWLQWLPAFQSAGIGVS